jgi:hypothetical protein
MTVISLATLCHSQRKYGKATRTYREAICITRKAVMNGDFRRVVLSWLRISRKASLRELHPLRFPLYSGPVASQGLKVA